jgi:hypothetical protein
MNAGRAADIRKLRGLKNISWLSSRQLNRLAAALSVSAVEKRDVIIAEKHSPDPAVRRGPYQLPQSQRRSYTRYYGCGRDDSRISAASAGDQL